MRSASTTSGSTWFDRCRPVCGVGILRQRSSISFSLASVLWTRANSLMCLSNTSASARAAASRLARSVSVSRFSVDSRFSSSSFARDLEHQPRHRLVEQAVPGGAAHDRLVVQELLQLVRQLVGAHRAHPVEHRLVAGKIGVLRQQARQMRLVQPVEFQREEHQRRGEGGDAVLHVGHELGPLAVHRVLVVAQAREGHQPPGGHVDLLIGQHAGQKAPWRPAWQACPRRSAAKSAQAFSSHAMSRATSGRVGRRVEVAQVPVGQLAESSARWHWHRRRGGAGAGSSGKPRSGISGHLGAGRGGSARRSSCARRAWTCQTS